LLPLFRRTRIANSFSYRLNIFGFPGDPTITNNLALLNQRLAIEWVRDNIEAFGGDPDRITMFGQSAGGSSVDYYSYAWTTDPIVAGFIAESGTVFTTGARASSSDAASSWYNVSANLGCGDATSDAATVLSCMRSKDWNDILEAIPSSISFEPTVDDTVVFSDYTARSVAGNITKKPMMIGSTDWEPGLVQPTFAIENETYPKFLWALYQFDTITCPISYRAVAGVVNKLPTWRYRWFGDFENLKLSTVPDWQGAYHGSEVPIIFGTDMDIQDKVARTTEEEAISIYMRGAWAAFAKDPVNGLIG
jgi:carboxylesterase type B